MRKAIFKILLFALALTGLSSCESVLKSKHIANNKEFEKADYQKQDHVSPIQNIPYMPIRASQSLNFFRMWHDVYARRTEVNDEYFDFILDEERKMNSGENYYGKKYKMHEFTPEENRYYLRELDEKYGTYTFFNPDLDILLHALHQVTNKVINANEKEVDPIESVYTLRHMKRHDRNPYSLVKVDPDDYSLNNKVE